jgi:hypothetical protein
MLIVCRGALSQVIHRIQSEILFWKLQLFLNINLGISYWYQAYYLDLNPPSPFLWQSPPPQKKISACVQVF